MPFPLCLAMLPGVLNQTNKIHTLMCHLERSEGSLKPDTSLCSAMTLSQYHVVRFRGGRRVRAPRAAPLGAGSSPCGIPFADRGGVSSLILPPLTRSSPCPGPPPQELLAPRPCWSASRRETILILRGIPVRGGQRVGWERASPWAPWRVVLIPFSPHPWAWYKTCLHTFTMRFLPWTLEENDIRRGVLRGTRRQSSRAQGVPYGRQGATKSRGL